MGLKHGHGFRYWAVHRAPTDLKLVDAHRPWGWEKTIGDKARLITGGGTASSLRSSRTIRGDDLKWGNPS